MCPGTCANAFLNHLSKESRSSVVFQERDETHFVTPADFSPRQHDDEDVEGKRVMTKWTEEEKHYAIQLLETYGKQWALISGMMEGRKKPEQIKNFFSVGSSTCVIVCHLTK